MPVLLFFNSILCACR